MVSDMGLSLRYDGVSGGGLRVVLPPGGRDLEAEEAVDDVEQRAEQVEEAEREVRRRGHPEHAGDVGAARVPRNEHRGDGAGVLDRTGQDLGSDAAAGE